MTNTFDFTFLRNIAYDAGIYQDNIRTDYSGRGMYGKECFGFTGTLSDLIQFVKAVTERVLENDNDEDAQLLYDNLESVNTDSMGYDTIFYFPGITVEGGEDD